MPSGASVACLRRGGGGGGENSLSEGQRAVFVTVCRCGGVCKLSARCGRHQWVELACLLVWVICLAAVRGLGSLWQGCSVSGPEPVNSATLEGRQQWEQGSITKAT